jgi:hypothetical protein
VTTEAAARLYEAQHLHQWQGRPLAVYNPHNKPVEELPYIYGFNNGGHAGWWSAVAMAEDGTSLGGHICSSEGYMPHDLGLIEGARPDRHEESYQKHYPDGYRMDFIPYSEVNTHEGLMTAIKNAEAKAQ